MAVVDEAVAIAMQNIDVSGHGPGSRFACPGRQIAPLADSIFKQPRQSTARVTAPRSARRPFFTSPRLRSHLSLRAPAKQSMARHRRIEDGLLRRFTPRNDAVGFSHTLLRSRGVKTPELCPTTPPREGAGNAGCALHPQSRVQKVKSTRGSHHRFTGATRHSPRNGFNGFLRDLPGDRALLSPSSCVYRKT